MKIPAVTCALTLALLPLGVAQGDLLLNGDFTVEGTDALNAANWTEWNNGGWVNRETNGNGPYGDTSNLHYAIGNAGAINNGVYQDVAVADDGAIYQLTADAALDAWWKPAAYVKIEFFDDVGGSLGFAEQWMPDSVLYDPDPSNNPNGPGFDIGVPWQPIRVSAAAPAGTATVRAALGAFTDGTGGTYRVDNAALIVIPEPTSVVLLGLGGLLVGVLRRRF